MIDRDEIDSKAKEFAIKTTDVERDYVFGWLLNGICSSSNLKDELILKGGNAFRKAYFPTTRYSEDLDFSTEYRVDPDSVKSQLNSVCDFVSDHTGIIFEKDRNLVRDKGFSDKDLKVFEARLYFKDFYGKPGNIVIKIKLDITEFDKVYLPLEKRVLIHPYSDSEQCRATIKCIKLEEMLASKLKCLLQRRHSLDLFDLVYAIFVNKELNVKKSEIVEVFLRKTIYERSPGVARNLFLGLPLDLFKLPWEKYLVCPKGSLIPFQSAVSWFFDFIKDVFEEDIRPFIENLFYPSEYRNLILQAGSEQKLLKVVYKGSPRIVEPYSLSYKRRKDGHAEEYFYVYQRSGGSGSDIRMYKNKYVNSMDILEEKFQPRYPVELSKAGEQPSSAYFSKANFKSSRNSSSRSTAAYTVECSYCGKRFPRKTYNTKINKHKDQYGNQCHGRHGYIV